MNEKKKKFVNNYDNFFMKKKKEMLFRNKENKIKLRFLVVGSFFDTKKFILFDSTKKGNK